MKPLLIFFVLLFIGAMFIIGENPKLNPFQKNDTNVTTDSSKVLEHEINASNKHMGEE